MKSNLFGKLSAGVAGVALMAIGVVSTPVQAAHLGIGPTPILDGAPGWGSTPAQTPALQVQFTPSIDGFGVFHAVFDLRYGSKLSNWNFDQNSVEGNSNSEANWIYTNPISNYFSNNDLIVDANVSLLKINTHTVVKSKVLHFVFADFTYNPHGQYWKVGTGSVGVVGDERKTSDFRYYAYVPEPSTYVGTILAFGALGAAKILKRKQKKQETFIP